MVKARVWKIHKYFEGFPQDGDLVLEEEDLPDVKDGEMLIEAMYLTVDPYMRLFVRNMGSLGGVMFGEQIARVVQSKNPDFPVGSYVRTHAGWRSHTIITTPTGKMPELGGLSPSLALGVLGMPGMAGYFGFLDICKPIAGETVLVNGAAGAVGSLVVQIAKIKGCKVIAFAGSEEKCQYLRDLGIDFVFNYKNINLETALKESAPDGIDCYFDNVGGDFTWTVLQHMKDFGRVSVCGQISGYNSDKQQTGILPYSTILNKQLKVQGFLVFSKYKDQYPEGEKQMLQWVKEGKIKFNETITEGFENMYTAFRGLFSGDNTGKAIVKC